MNNTKASSGTATAVRGIFNKKMGLPVPGALPSKTDPLFFNEEGVVIGFGLFNHSTLESRMALYKVIDGTPRAMGFYSPKAGSNGIRARSTDHQGPVNWLQGILSEVAVNGLKDGHYFLPAAVARGMNSRSLQLPLAPRSCVDLAKGLTPAKEPLPFDVVTIDEIGAPGRVEEVPVKASKLRQILTNRVLSNLWVSNPVFVQTWRNALSRAMELWESHEETVAATAVSQIQEKLSEALQEHARMNWITGEDANGKLLWKRPFFPGLLAKLYRIIDFFPTLTQERDDSFYPLQICQRDASGAHTPLFVGVSGSPITIKGINAPPNWEFPTTWERSPFDQLNGDEEPSGNGLVYDPMEVEAAA